MRNPFQKIKWLVCFTLLAAVSVGASGCKPVPDLLIEVNAIPMGARYLDMIIWEDPMSKTPRAHKTNGSDRLMIDMGTDFPGAMQRTYRIGVDLPSTGKDFAIFLAAFKEDAGKACFLNSARGLQGAGWLGIAELTIPFPSAENIDRTAKFPELCKPLIGGGLKDPIVVSQQLDSERLAAPGQEDSLFKLRGWNFHPPTDATKAIGVTLQIDGVITSGAEGIPAQNIPVTLYPPQPSSPDRLDIFLTDPSNVTHFDLMTKGALTIRLTNIDDMSSTTTNIPQSSIVRD